MAHLKQGYRFENDWTMEKLKELKENWKSAVTIPVNVEIEAEHCVLNLEKVKEYLSKAHLIVLLDCGCRTFRHNCDAPLNTCIIMNDYAGSILKREKSKSLNPRKVVMEEALDALARSHEAGLVHMAYASGKDQDPDQVNVICSCCSCCCAIFSAVLRFGLAPHLLTSETISAADISKCKGCGVCAERCPFGAREIVEGSLVFKHELCFGCGLCVSTCPTIAIKLIDK
jgi:ferredoxin